MSRLRAGLIVLTCACRGVQDTNVQSTESWKPAYVTVEENSDPAARRLFADAIDHLKHQVADGIEIPGIPASSAPSGVTVRFQDAPREGVAAKAMPTQGVINVQAKEFLSLNQIERDQVIRHEIAHVGLEAFFNSTPLPEWLEEGYAEWASGDGDCRWSSRVWLELIRRERTGEEMPDIVRGTNTPTGRLRRDFLASFFSYLEERQPGSLSNGKLLSSFKSEGIPKGFANTYGYDLHDLQLKWHEALQKSRGQPPRRECNAQRVVR